jgi:hypothetical protein
VLATGGRRVDDGLTERLFRRANATLEDRKGKRAMTAENAAYNRTQHGAVVAMPPPLPEQQPHLPSYLHLHEVRQCLLLMHDTCAPKFEWVRTQQCYRQASCRLEVVRPRCSPTYLLRNSEADWGSKETNLRHGCISIPGVFDPRGRELSLSRFGTGPRSPIPQRGTSIASRDTLRDTHAHTVLCAHHPQGVRKVRMIQLTKARNTKRLSILIFTCR